MTGSTSLKIFVAGSGARADAARAALVSAGLTVITEVDPSTAIIVVADTGAVSSLQSFPNDAIVIVDTETVERSTLQIFHRLKLTEQRLLGVGAVAQSERFRSLIAERLTVAVEHIQGFIAGETGDNLTLLWSSVTVAGIPLHQWAVPHHGKMSVRDRIDIMQSVKFPLSDAQSRAGLVQVVRSVAEDSHRILPVSVITPSASAFGQSCLSLPSIVNRKGVDAILPMPLNDAERAGLIATADRLRLSV